MRMDNVADTIVPTITWAMVCFFNITLDIAINGVRMKTNGSQLVYGKR